MLTAPDAEIRSSRDGFLAAMVAIASSQIKLVRASLATFSLNLVVALRNTGASVPDSEKIALYRSVFAALQTMLLAEQESVDTIFRSSLAIGAACLADAVLIGENLQDELLALVVTLSEPGRLDWAARLTRYKRRSIVRRLLYDCSINLV